MQLGLADLRATFKPTVLSQREYCNASSWYFICHEPVNVKNQLNTEMAGYQRSPSQLANWLIELVTHCKQA